MEAHPDPGRRDLFSRRRGSAERRSRPVRNDVPAGPSTSSPRAETIPSPGIRGAPFRSPASDARPAGRARKNEPGSRKQLDPPLRPSACLPRADAAVRSRTAPLKAPLAEALRDRRRFSIVTGVALEDDSRAVRRAGSDAAGELFARRSSPAAISILAPSSSGALLRPGFRPSRPRPRAPPETASRRAPGAFSSNSFRETSPRAVRTATKFLFPLRQAHPVSREDVTAGKKRSHIIPGNGIRRSSGGSLASKPLRLAGRGDIADVFAETRRKTIVEWRDGGGPATHGSRSKQASRRAARGGRERNRLRLGSGEAAIREARPGRCRLRQKDRSPEPARARFGADFERGSSIERLGPAPRAHSRRRHASPSPPALVSRGNPRVASFPFGSAASTFPTRAALLFSIGSFTAASPAGRTRSRSSRSRSGSGCDPRTSSDRALGGAAARTRKTGPLQRRNRRRPLLPVRTAAGFSSTRSWSHALEAGRRGKRRSRDFAAARVSVSDLEGPGHRRGLDLFGGYERDDERNAGRGAVQAARRGPPRRELDRPRARRRTRLGPDTGRRAGPADAPALARFEHGRRRRRGRLRRK